MTGARLGAVRGSVALACFIHVLCVPGVMAAPVCGDADGSGTVTVTDGVQTLRAAAGLPSACTVPACDVDGSGTITVTDGVNVLRAAAGLPNPCAANATPTPSVAPTPAPTSSAAAILNNGEWVIAQADATIPEAPFAVSIDGAAAGTARALVFSNRVTGTTRFPQVFVVYASGFLRLKAGADPIPPLPFGQSLVLGPAVFGTSDSCPATTLFFNPQLTSVAVDTTALAADGTGTLGLNIVASALAPGTNCTRTNQIMSLAWEIQLEEPTTAGTRLTVAGTFSFTEEVQPDANRTAERQSFRLVQISSMFIDGNRHDVDAFRFRSPNGSVTIVYDPATVNTLLPTIPGTLDPQLPILDSCQIDDSAEPNGKTPNYRIELGAVTGPISGAAAPRAFVTPSDDVNDDNVGLWLHMAPSSVISAGTMGSVAYTVTETTALLLDP